MGFCTLFKKPKTSRVTSVVFKIHLVAYLRYINIIHLQVFVIINCIVEHYLVQYNCVDKNWHTALTIRRSVFRKLTI